MHEQHAMEEMGNKPTPEELETFMSEVDLDGNGTVGAVSLNPPHTSRLTSQLIPYMVCRSTPDR